MNISVVINTFNADLHLKKVLDGVKEFDEIVICDMGSTDRTIEIAQEFNCHILSHEKMSIVEPARNFAIQSAKNDWVLLLDADELITEKLKKELLTFKENTEGYTVLALPRKNYFLGKWMRAAYPDYVYRFFRKENVVWPPYVHSIPEIKGRILKIESSRYDLAIEHLANDSVNAVIEKNNRYSEVSIGRKKATDITALKLIFSPFFWFVKYYFLKKGFLDGKQGLIFAVLKSHYKFNSLAKMVEAKSYES